jgi:hypothetical protein
VYSGSALKIGYVMSLVLVQQKKGSIMGSSQKRASNLQGLISPKRAEKFLKCWANLDYVDHDVADKLARIYPDIAEPYPQPRNELWLLFLRDGIPLLRGAFETTDARERNWYTTEIEHFYLTTSAEAKGINRPRTPPPMTALEAALIHFRTRIGERAKRCRGSNCPRGPFFVATKKWQRFCSEACAGPANREAKRLWWHEHKEEIKKKKEAQKP